VAWARRVVAAAEASAGSATAVDGAMIDKPVIDRAQRILDEARAPAA
jgi:citrate lyase subunit beta/citryl-CoA lyase